MPLTPTTLARLDALARPLLVRLPPTLAVRLYSAGRRRFLDRLVASAASIAPAPTPPPAALARTLWGIHFRSPLGNAAGMFKNGQGYPLVAHQGAGYYLAGTTTAAPRPGNVRAGVRQPFAPYPRSGAASNWLGLPNDGHAAVAARLARVVREERVDGCPVGASLASLPGCSSSPSDAERTSALVEGLERYTDAGVDFLEINESCPNTEAGAASVASEWEELRQRLEALAEGFFARHRERPPVVVKFSLDTTEEQAAELVDLLVELGFDGIDLGNTSTAYATRREAIDPRERRLFDHFTGRYGGGVSGRPVKGASLALARAAVARVRKVAPEREFHVVRTGGIENGADLAESARAGVALDGWYTGYFEAFAAHGHRLYARIYEELLELLREAGAEPSGPPNLASSAT